MGIIAVGITGRNDGSTIRNLPIDAAPDDAQVPEQTEFLAVGTVLSGGAALPGATVTLTGPVSDAIVTDGVGTFTFEEIPAGAYVLTPQATGFTFAPETIALTITDANSRDNDFAGTLIVPEIESITPPSVLFGSPATDIAITGGPFEVAPVCGQLGGLFKVYSGCRSSCQNLLGSIFLSPLLRRWVSGQGA